MFEQTFKNLDDVLRKEAGCSSELDYTEQTSWLLFLKYLEAADEERAQTAILEGRDHSPLLPEKFKWSTWATDRDLTGPDLIDFVDTELFPHLEGFRQRAASPDTIEYKIGEIFSEIRNKFRSGYSLRDALDLIDELQFRSQQEKHELSDLDESRIKNMGNAGRNGGEYYTPRPLIRAMIAVTKPVIGDRIYDGACGSAGFLCEAFDYLRHGDSPHLKSQISNLNLSPADLQVLRTQTFYGREKKSLAYVIAIMNLILHGIEAPNIIHTNTLANHTQDVSEKDRYDLILANPPFGGKERKEVQQNFPIKTGETAFLFLQHFIRHLRPGGRAAIVIKNTFLSNSDNASVALRRELLESCNLHTILDCPGGTFQGAGVKTVVLFFEKGAPTRRTWFYQLTEKKLGRRLGKTNPLNDNDLADFVEKQATFADSENSWSLDRADIPADTCDLSVKNPNTPEAAPLRAPADIIAEIRQLDQQAKTHLTTIEGILK